MKKFDYSLSQDLFRHILNHAKEIVFSLLAIGINILSIYFMTTRQEFYSFSSAFFFYSLLLVVLCFGLPLAGSYLLLRYSLENDNRTVLIIRRLIVVWMGILGLVGAIIMIIGGYPLSNLCSIGGNGSAFYRTVLVLSLAIWMHAMATAIRSFYLCQRRKAFACSLWISSLVPIFFNILAYMICTKFLAITFLPSPIAAVGILLGGACSFFYLYRYDQLHSRNIHSMALAQKQRATYRTSLVKELFSIASSTMTISFLTALPFLLALFLFVPLNHTLSADALIMEGSGISCVYILVFLLIPMAFVGCIRPAKRFIKFDIYDKNRKLACSLEDIILSVLFFAAFFGGFLFFLAKPLAILLEFNEIVTTFLSLSGLLMIFVSCSIVSINIMSFCGYKHDLIIYLAIACIGSVVATVLLAPKIGLFSVLIGLFLQQAILLFLCINHMSNRYELDCMRIVQIILRTFLAVICVNGIYAAAKLFLPFLILEKGPYLFITICICILLSFGVYVFAGVRLYIFKMIYHKNFRELWKELFHAS